MKVRMVYWADTIGGRVEDLELELKPFGYKMAPITQWKSLIADEDIYVEKGEPRIVKIKTIEIPENTMVGPPHIMRHALGSVIDIVECGIPERVEEDKCINQVLFLPIESGEIKKGDLVGVLKVFFVRAGLLSRIFNLNPPKVELEEEIIEAYLTWRDNGNVYRERFRTEVFGYTRSHIGVWETIVAKETVKVKKGEVVRINIREVKLPPNTVVVPLGVMLNAYGSLIDVIELGRPSKVEEEKRIHQAIFMPVMDGVVEEGDLLGIINVYYVGVKNVKTLPIEKEPERVSMVYRSGEGVIRKDVEVEPFGYKRSGNASWEVIISREDKKLKRGEPAVIAVKPIKLPKNTITYPLSIMRHAYGTFLDIFLHGPPKKVEEEDRTIRKIVFLPVLDGEVKEGDLLGILNIYKVDIGPLSKLKTWLDNWLDEMGKAFQESDWPMW